MDKPVNGVTLGHTANATVVNIVGEIDIATAPEIRAAITEAIQTSTASVVVIDLRGVTFMGSPGLSALLTAESQATAKGVRLGVVTGDNRIVLRPLQITGLDKTIPIQPTLDELEAAMSGNDSM